MLKCVRMITKIGTSQWKPCLVEDREKDSFCLCYQKRQRCALKVFCNEFNEGPEIWLGQPGDGLLETSKPLEADEKVEIFAGEKLEEVKNIEEEKKTVFIERAAANNSEKLEWNTTTTTTTTAAAILKVDEPQSSVNRTALPATLVALAAIAILALFAIAALSARRKKRARKNLAAATMRMRNLAELPSFQDDNALSIGNANFDLFIGQDAADSGDAEIVVPIMQSGSCVTLHHVSAAEQLQGSPQGRRSNRWPGSGRLRDSETANRALESLRRDFLRASWRSSKKGQKPPQPPQVQRSTEQDEGSDGFVSHPLQPVD